MIRYGQAKDLGGKAPATIVVFRDGANRCVWEDGAIRDFWMDEKAATSIIHHFNFRGTDLVVDYEHASERGGEAPAAGFIPLGGLDYKPGVGLEAKVNWTDRAKAAIEAGEYRYFSPVWHEAMDGSQRVVTISSVALTNQPALINLQPLAARQWAATIRGRGANMDPLALILAEIGITEKLDIDAGTKAATAWVKDAKEKLASVTVATETAEKATASVKKIAAAFNCGNETDPDKIIAASKKTDNVIDPTKFVPRDEYDKLFATVQAQQQVEAVRAQAEFMSRGTRDGKIIASQRGIWESLYKADAKDAEAKLRDAPVLASTQRVSGEHVTDEHGNGRQAIIAAANRDYDSTPGNRFTSREFFIQDALREAKLETKLTAKEKETVGLA